MAWETGGDRARVTGSTTPPASGYESPAEDNPPLGMVQWKEKSLSDSMVGGLTSAERENARRLPFSSPSSLNVMMTKAQQMTQERKVCLRDRIQCYQWTWFTMTMV